MGPLLLERGPILLEWGSVLSGWGGRILRVGAHTPTEIAFFVVGSPQGWGGTFRSNCGSQQGSRFSFGFGFGFGSGPASASARAQLRPGFGFGSQHAATINSCGGARSGGHLSAAALRICPTSLAPWRLLQASSQMFHA